MKIQDTEALGQWVRAERKKVGVTQRELALAAGTGLRWIIELEQGKTTCEIGKVLAAISALGHVVEVRPQ